MNSNIPVKNLYYLYLYAWDRFDEGKSQNISTEKFKDLPNLVSKILINSTKRLIKKGLYKVYSSTNEELSFVRGKIDFKKTINNNLLKKGKLSCIIDELSINSIPNQIIKKTLLNLLFNNNLDKSLKSEVKYLMKYFENVNSDKTISKYFSSFKFNNNNSYYRFSLNLCRLLNDLSSPTEKKGNYLFNEPEDEKSMGLVFESFLRNFYRLEQSEYKVSSDRFPWDVDGDEYDLSLLQDNVTDITLRKNDRTLVIDAKFYKDPLTSNYGKFKIRQDNLRQIHSYLINLENRNGPDSKADGMLIYPQVTHQESINSKVKFRGHDIYFKSLNLNSSWENIHNQLLSFI